MTSQGPQERNERTRSCDPRARRPPARRPPARLRPATAADIKRCGVIWREALNDYFGRLGLPEVPDELESIGRLHAHTLATDPERFVMAEDPAAPDGPAIGFAAAVRRGPVWYLSMLFVAPAHQRAGVGRALLDRVLPPPDERSNLSLALASDSAQPISNGLYASLGIVPRLPVYHVVGRPNRSRRGSRLTQLPSDVKIEEPADGSAGAEVEAIDRDVLGFAHPEDHRYAHESGRRLHLYRRADGSAAAYGYVSPVGHVGPVAVRDADLLPAVVDHLLASLQPRGASAVWVPGAAGGTLTALVRAGMRLDGFPILLCWSRPFADFSRYLPTSPGLL